MVITICGSSKFKDEILKAAHDFTMQGHIVLAPAVFHHADEEELTPEDKVRLDNLHREKINMSDAIFVINKDQYIGESTFGEIDWADRMKKQIYFLEEIPGATTKAGENGEPPTPIKPEDAQNEPVEG